MTTPASAVVAREQNPKQRYAAIEGLVEERRDAIVRTLPATVDPDMFINVALQAVTRTPRLMECTPQSIVKALRDAAEVGLVPSGLLGSAYLVPYYSKHAKSYEAQFQAGYRGLIDLARRSGEVRLIEAHVVRERDDFAFAYGTEGFIRHVPYLNLTGERGPETVDERGEPKMGELLDGGKYIAAYARAVLTSGEEQFEVMSITEVEAIRRRSKASDEGPWVTDYAEMARKTPTRRLLKYLPLSASALTRALEMEDAAESRSTRPPARQVGSGASALASTLLGNGESSRTPEQEPEGEPDDRVVIDGGTGEVLSTDGCGHLPDPNPLGITLPCTKDAGHSGTHQSEDGTWPAD